MYRETVVGSSKSGFNSSNRATSAALPASEARYIFVRPSSSRALMSAGVAVVVVAIESVCAAQVWFVVFWLTRRKKTRTKRDEKREIRQRPTFIWRKEIKNKTKTQNPQFVLASCCLAARCGWKTTVKARAKKMFVFNRDACAWESRQTSKFIWKRGNLLCCFVILFGFVF